MENMSTGEVLKDICKRLKMASEKVEMIERNEKASMEKVESVEYMEYMEYMDTFISKERFVESVEVLKEYVRWMNEVEKVVVFREDFVGKMVDRYVELLMEVMRDGVRDEVSESDGESDGKVEWDESKIVGYVFWDKGESAEEIWDELVGK